MMRRRLMNAEDILRVLNVVLMNANLLIALLVLHKQLKTLRKIKEMEAKRIAAQACKVQCRDDYECLEKCLELSGVFPNLRT